MQAEATEDSPRSAPDAPSQRPTTDGRVARGQRTRRRVAEALVDLLADGEPEPTAKAIAERAGVSLRLVFHHFGDIDDLYQTVATLQLERHWGDLPQFSPRLALPTRIERTVRHRSVLYEEIAPVRRAALRRAPTSAGVTELLARADGMLRENLSAAFAPELAAQPPTESIETLAALDAVSSWEAWERMRWRSDMNVVATRRVMTRTMSALLGSEV
jgi:TetR/AcrR family transcriptional regulator of autoinduction and epiphytic fitness